MNGFEGTGAHPDKELLALIDKARAVQGQLGMVFEEMAGTPNRRRVDVLERRVARLHDKQGKLLARISRTPARTKDAVLAKVALTAKQIEEDEREDDTIDSVLASAALDLANIGGQHEHRP
jgi:hypothetical protein